MTIESTPMTVPSIPMTILIEPDPSVPIACVLPLDEWGAWRKDYQALYGGHLQLIAREPGRLRLVVDRGDRVDLEAVAIAQLRRDKEECRPFLGFAFASERAAITIEISAAAGAEASLDEVELMMREYLPAATVQ